MQAVSAVSTTHDLAVQAVSLEENRIQIPVGSVLRLAGSWEDYCQLRDARGDGSNPRIKYRNGEILLMSPLPHFPGILLQDIIDKCFAMAKESGTGAAISQFRKSLLGT